MKVLVAFNNLTPKSHSLIEAEDWAKKRGAEMHLIHVANNDYASLYWDTEGVSSPTLGEIELYEQDLKAFEELEKALQVEVDRLKNDGIVASGMLTRGDPATEILDRAKELEVDLIIVGNHKKDGFQGAIYKSIIENADRPVLVVPTVE